MRLAACAGIAAILDRASHALVILEKIDLHAHSVGALENAHVEQAVSNITYNAIRYNHPGGHVGVTVDPEPPDGFVIRVVDDGPGIPEAELLKLTERGARGNEARTRAPEGRGLGIDIARRAAEMHGFQLTFLRSEYGGLEVRFEGKRV